MKIILDTDKKTITVPWNYTAKLEEIKHDAEQNARRVDVIFTEKEAKEAAAKDEVQKTVNDTASADLPDMLTGLLRDYRKR